MIPNCDWVIILNFRGLLNCAIWMTQSYMFIVSTSLKMLVQLDRHQYHPKFVYLVTITYDKCFKTVLIGTVRERLQPSLPCDCFGQLTGHRRTYKLDLNCPYLSTSTLLLCSVWFLVNWLDERYSRIFYLISEMHVIMKVFLQQLFYPKINNYSKMTIDFFTQTECHATKFPPFIVFDLFLKHLRGWNESTDWFFWLF